ncbi:PREDICTED: LOW QUALITY PROTEIN: uncharacterized protein C6orf201 homolog [Chrysochloris asiatica]|uniref:LOW QUALITY PROTEIN: uncharacterized protein C6orf201 homolog n=1 Tax=Chrysochloris asiatica TaxID=185453 RepID=A0A9B0U1I4_CHRAS|nr:PREDICTED: LOW QUALITY PROTEIN: uncharacterized protein C6orf201 homolog [Chrysochloris asiatica]
METARNTQITLKFPPLDRSQKVKNYDRPDVLHDTFKTLSALHKLLPSRLTDVLYSYKSEEDKRKCRDSELSGLERMLARQQLLEEIHLTPKPSSQLIWKRRANDNASHGWKRCRLWRKAIKEPPMSTVVVRWLKRNLQPTEDIQSVIQKLSVFGPIQSFTHCGRQSAVVVFKDVTSACNAVNAFSSRSPGNSNSVQCSWQQQFMSKDVRFLCKSLQLTLQNSFPHQVKYHCHKRDVSTEKGTIEVYLVQALVIRVVSHHFLRCP